jgi:hypothetical protein
MTRRFTFLVVPAALVATISLPASAAAPPLTPDQQLVAGLEEARSAARETLRGKAELRVLFHGMRNARKAAPLAVGALESAAIQAALSEGMTLAMAARKASSSCNDVLARPKLRRLVALTSAALDDFGIPLERDFPAFAVSRAFPYLPEFENYSGLSATVGADVSEVVIGAADRQTANAGELGAAVMPSAKLPITHLSAAVFSDPLGNFTSGWCGLESGLITCRIRPAMPRDRIFTIAFGPKLPKGTKLLVKFRAAAGDRSYAVLTTR